MNMNNNGLDSWICEKEMKDYLFFHVHFFNKLQKNNLWLAQVLRSISKGDNDSIYDMGCGSGSAAFVFSESFSNVIGVDSSKIMLSVANQQKRRRNIDNVTFTFGNMLDFPCTEAKSVYTSSLSHLLGEDSKVAFLKNLYDAKNILHVYIYSLDIVKNIYDVKTGIHKINQWDCNYCIRSNTNHALKRHFVKYDFLFQNKEYRFAYCFDILTYADIKHLAEMSGWIIAKVITNDTLRVEQYKNFVAQESVYILERK